MNKQIKWEELPVEIQNRMLDCQEEQGNERNPDVFKKNINTGKGSGGFMWDITEERSYFWETILIAGRLDYFFTKHPKQKSSAKDDSTLGKAKRYNKGKLKHQLIDPFVAQLHSRRHSLGSMKYDDFNWKKGQDFISSLGSIKRHINAFERGENYDHDWDDDHIQTYGLPHHLDAAMWGLETLMWQFFHKKEMDNREYRAPQRIGLDIDGVIADFGGHFLKYGKGQGWFDDVDTPVHSWNDYRFRDHFHKIPESFWLDIPAIVKGEDLQFDPCCYITARPISSDVTREWLRKNNFPLAVIHTVGVDGSKLEALRKSKVELFVEDHFHNWKMAFDQGILSYLVTRGHNKKFSVPDALRINCISELDYAGKK